MDHGLRLIHYLYLFQPGSAYFDGRILLATSQSLTILLKPGRHRISLRGSAGHTVGEKVGIISIGRLSLVTTEGLEQDVKHREVILGNSIYRSNALPGTSAIKIGT